MQPSKGLKIISAPVKSAVVDPEEEARRRRIANGKAQGLDDATIQKYELIRKIQQQQTQAQAQPTQTTQPVQQNKPSGLKKFLVNAGALAAHIGAGIGSVALAPETGGLSLGIGAGAGTAIDALKRKLLGEKQDLKSSLISGGLDVLPGIGEAKNAIRGAKVADEVVQGAKVVGNASTAKSVLGTVKDAFATPKQGIISNMLDNSGTKLRANVVNPQVPASITGAATKANIVSNVDKLVPGLTAASKYKNLEPAISKISDQIKPILEQSTDTVSKKTLLSNIKTAARQSDNFIAGDTAHEKALDTFLKDLTVKNGGKELSAKDLFEYKQGLNVGSAFEKLKKGANLTPNEAAKLSIWQNIDSEITRLAPEVKPLTLQQSALYQSAKGLDKAANKTLGIPILGIKSKTAAGVAQGLEEIGGKTVQSVAKIASNPIINTGVKQQLAKSLLLPKSQSSEQLPANPSELFPNAQQPHEVLGNYFQQQGITDPQQMFDTLTAIEQSQQPQAQSTDQPAQSGNQLSATSSDLFNAALSAPDSKTRTAYLDAAKTAFQFENADRTFQLAKDKQSQSSTKLSAAQQTRKDSITSALASLDATETNLIGGGGAKGVKGEIGKLPWIGKYVDSEGAAYHRTRVEVATNLAKAITGGARAPESVINKYLESLPDINDPPAYAQQKLQNIRNDLLAQAKKFNFTDIVDSYNGTDSSATDTTSGFDFNSINQLFNTQGAY